METIYLDTETTGLDPSRDELLEIGIVDNNGTPLFSSLVKPVNNICWPEAESIHGISSSMVKNAPALTQLMLAIRQATEGRRVVIYNASFDVGFLPILQEWAAEIHCAMLAYSEQYGEWSEYFGNRRWVSLRNAARHVLHEWDGDAHRAVADASACRSVWRYLTEPEVQVEVDNTRAARAALEQKQWQKERRARQHQERMDTFWQHWWLGRYGVERHWANSEWNCEDVLALLFYGKSLRVLELEISPLPKYRKQADIPAELHSQQWFPAWKWLREELQPCAVYLGNKQGWWLYHESELARLKQQYPLRFVAPQPGEMTRTELRRQGYTEQQIAEMTPVREAMQPFAFYWYYLYLP